MSFNPIGDATSVTLERALEGVSARQKIIAQNVANASTPGYRAQAVKFEDALAQAVSSGQPDSASYSIVDAGTPAKADGNTVDLTTEMTSMTQAGLLYDTLVQATNFKINSVRSALSR